MYPNPNMYPMPYNPYMYNSGPPGPPPGPPPGYSNTSGGYNYNYKNRSNKKLHFYKYFF